jgi:hypothetical protein
MIRQMRSPARTRTITTLNHRTTVSIVPMLANGGGNGFVSLTATEGPL